LLAVAIAQSCTAEYGLRQDAPKRYSLPLRHVEVAADPEFTIDEWATKDANEPILLLVQGSVDNIVQIPVADRDVKGRFLMEGIRILWNDDESWLNHQ
jgi:hypothetical protein